MRQISILIILTLWLTGHPAMAQRLRFDHAIIAVHDMQAAKKTFHRNGLLNCHVKFRNGTEIELMTLTRPPSDYTSNAYGNFLQTGEGGAYIALGGIATASISSNLKLHHIAHRVIRGRLWDYVVFAPASGLDHLFFIERHDAIAQDPASPHDNGTTAIRRIWIEGDERLERLLNIFNIRPCAAD